MKRMMSAKKIQRSTRPGSVRVVAAAPGSLFAASSVPHAPLISVVEVLHEVEEQRRREREAVDAIQDPAVTGNQRPGVLHAEIALQRGDRDVSDESTHTE